MTDKRLIKEQGRPNGRPCSFPHTSPLPNSSEYLMLSYLHLLRPYKMFPQLLLIDIMCFEDRGAGEAVEERVVGDKERDGCHLF